MDRVIRPRTIARIPVEIVRETIEATARADPDSPTLLSMTCMAWKRLVIETSWLWSNINFDVDNADMLETLFLSLLMSKNWPLDIAMTGICVSDEVLNSTNPHVHRICALELLREPFRVSRRYATRWLKLLVPTRH